MLAKVAETAAVAYASRDERALDELVSGPYLADSLAFEREPQSLAEVKVCDQWGNERLVFANTVIAFESEDEIGYRSLLTIVGTNDGRPRLFEIGDSSKIIATLREQVPLLTDGATSPIFAPVVSKPQDGSSFFRFPVDRRPDLAWASPNQGSFFYLLEWQFGQNGTNPDWRGSGFAFVNPPKGTSSSIMKAPFGVGKQPHRWRVWAIDEHGDVARSEWRIVNYLN